MTESVRRGHQLTVVIEQFKLFGNVSAHELWMEGISRTAAIIHTLRQHWGEDSIRTDRKPGEMATYVLVKPPKVWDIPRQPRAKRAAWTCSTCGNPATNELNQRTPTLATSRCATCGAERVFRRG